MCLLVWCFGSGCHLTPPLNTYTRLDANEGGLDKKLSRDALRRLASELKPGDIILGAKNGAMATLLRLSLGQYSYYTHSGVVDIRHGKVVVSHATGRFKLFQKTPHLLEKMRGSVEHISLERFLRTYYDIKVYRLPDKKKNRRMVESSLRHEQEKTPFDCYFDPLDPKAVHCTEYTAQVLKEAGYEHGFDLVSRTHNQSLSDLLGKLGITTEYFLRIDAFVELPGTKLVAEFSRYGTRAVSMGTAGGLQVLHEEVNHDPALRVGDLISCNMKRMVHFSEPLRLYLLAVTGMAERNPTTDETEILRRNRLLYDIIVRPHVRRIIDGGALVEVPIGRDSS